MFICYMDPEFYRNLDVSVKVTQKHLLAVHTIPFVKASSLGASFSAVILVQCLCYLTG